MRPRRLITLSGLALLVLLLGIYWWQSEPRYRGKSLTSWLRGFESEVGEARWQSTDAVRHIGSNAVPFLLVKLHSPRPYPEPEWKQKLRVVLSRHSILNINLPRPADERAEALAALDALGPVAKDVVPAVEALLHQQPHPDPRAILVLGRLGPDGESALTRALTNEVKVIRTGARVCLDMLQSHSEVLFPKTIADAEFTRRQCQLNLSILQAASQEYVAQHPEVLLQGSLNGKPPLTVPPVPVPNDNRRTTLPVPRTQTSSAGFE